MLMENSLLGKVDIKAVYREIKKSGNENSTIMDHVCRSGESEKENDQDKENEVHIKDVEDHSVRTEEDDPFTEAGAVSVQPGLPTQMKKFQLCCLLLKI